MFTGLVDDIGTIDRVSSTDAGLETACALRLSRSAARGERCPQWRLPYRARAGRWILHLRRGLTTLAVTTMERGA